MKPPETDPADAMLADAIAIRTAFGLTVAEIAAHGINANTAHRALTGKSKPTWGTALMLRRACSQAALKRILAAKKISARVKVTLAL